MCVVVHEDIGDITRSKCRSQVLIRCITPFYCILPPLCHVKERSNHQPDLLEYLNTHMFRLISGNRTSN